MGINQGNTNSGPSRKPNLGGVASNQQRGYIARKRSEFAWRDIEADEIGRFVQRCSAAGVACILGRTSDGGALSITILDGDNRVRDWPATVEAFNEFNVWICDTYGVD